MNKECRCGSKLEFNAEDVSMISCPACGKPVRDLFGAPEASEESQNLVPPVATTKPGGQQGARRMNIVLAMIAYIAVMVWIGWNRAMHQQRQETERAHAATRARIAAGQEAKMERVKKAVRDRLLAPTSAKFEFLYEREEDGQPVVWGKVHAQNIYGAMLEDSFTVYLKRFDSYGHPQRGAVKFSFEGYQFERMGLPKKEEKIWR